MTIVDSNFWKKDDAWNMKGVVLGLFLFRAVYY